MLTSGASFDKPILTGSAPPIREQVFDDPRAVVFVIRSTPDGVEVDSYVPRTVDLPLLSEVLHSIADDVLRDHRRARRPR